MKAKDMVYISLMVVLIAVCSWLMVPAVIPFTMQTFGIFCALCLLGGKRGSMAVLIYIAMGAFGLPVFSGFTGGIGKILGATGGYIIGFLPTALCYWGVTAALGNKTGIKAAGMLLGLILCYAFGTAWYIYVYASKQAVSVTAALGMCVVPFIVPDLIKLALALGMERILKKHISIE